MLDNPSQFLLDEPHHGHFRRLLRRTDVPFEFDLDIDNSTLASYRSCPRSFEFSALYGRDTAYRDALNYGSAIHAALETFYRDDADLDTMLDVLRSAFHAKPTDSDSWRTFDHAAESLRRYLVWHAQMLPWTVLSDVVSGQRFVELPFRRHLFTYNTALRGHRAGMSDAACPTVLDWPLQLVASNIDTELSLVDALAAQSMKLAVTKIHVYYTGKIDMLVEQDGAVCVVDHKTTSIEGSTFWSQFTLSAQMRGYCWAASQLLDADVQNAVIDALIGRKPTKTGVAHEFSRMTFRYSREQLDAWRRDAECQIRTLLDQFVRGYFPTNTDSCYGKFPCQFREVCPLPASIQATALRSGAFVPRTWSPLTTH